MSSLFIIISNDRINGILMLLLTEHSLLQENAENYEHSLKQDCSTQWPDEFWALSKEVVYKLYAVPWREKS